jgi:hypothetical protein
VFAYCLRNRLFTHEQHLCDFCKFEKSPRYRDRASLVSMVYGACFSHVVNSQRSVKVVYLYTHASSFKKLIMAFLKTYFSSCSQLLKRYVLSEV